MAQPRHFLAEMVSVADVLLSRQHLLVLRDLEKGEAVGAEAVRLLFPQFAPADGSGCYQKQSWDWLDNGGEGKSLLLLLLLLLQEMQPEASVVAWHHPPGEGCR